MYTQTLVLILLLGAALPCSAIDVNQATEAELDGIKGLGPATTEKILRERQKAPFRDWNDLIGRVAGVGKGSAARLSCAGLTVNNQALPGQCTPSAAGTAPTQER